jgi:hypothetical protein
MRNSEDHGLAKMTGSRQGFIEPEDIPDEPPCPTDQFQNAERELDLDKPLH